MAESRPSTRLRTLTWLTFLLVACVAVSLLGQHRPNRGQDPGDMKRTALRQMSRKAVSSGDLRYDERGVRRGGARYATNHVVARFDPALSVRDLRAVAARVGALGVRRLTYADFEYVDIAPGQDPVAVAEELAAQPGVLYAEPDPVIYPLWGPNDPFYKYQWNFTKIGMESAWDINRGGRSSVTVAVIDTGVAYLNSGIFVKAPDLATTTFVPGYDFIWDDAEPVDTDGHGTHVTGTIAQSTDNNVGTAGIAFNVRIMPIKVLASDWDEEQGAPFGSTMSVLARGIRWAVDHGAQVINLSLGAEGGSSAVESAIQYAVGAGAFVAIAAGNSGDEDNAAEWPASYARTMDGVMAVAAVGYDFKRAPYSTHRDYVEIAAPGGNVDQDLNTDSFGDGILQQTLDHTSLQKGIFNKFGYYFYQGTSMAAPHVAGMAALLRDQGITKPQAIEAAIKKFASNKPSGGRNDDLGYGLLDARATIRGLGLAK